MLRLERHELGPRVYLLGIRVHEVALGIAVLGVLLCGGLAELWEPGRGLDALGVVGAWLVAKDWRDLFPSRRNTARWAPLLHRVDRRRATVTLHVHPRVTHEVCVARSRERLLQTERSSRLPRRPRLVERRYGERWGSWVVRWCGAHARALSEAVRRRRGEAAHHPGTAPPRPSRPQRR